MPSNRNKPLPSTRQSGSGSGSGSSNVGSSSGRSSSYSSSGGSSSSRHLIRKRLWKLACVNGAVAVCMGAFAAHGVRRRVRNPASVASFATAAHYQLLHSAALLFAAQASDLAAGSLLAAGVAMFSGSIYALVLNPDRFAFLGPVTPAGGLCMIAGWIKLAFN
ncbi:DUF423-domain-containing protein [Hypoxylon sp. FL1284]|nr:DUF423-domain-containing protein [Hypoxylon sp. FL1284]